MLSTQIIGTQSPPGTLHAPVEVEQWAPNFPSADLVDAAAGMFHGHRISDRALGVTLDGLDVSGPSGRKSRELFPAGLVPAGTAGLSFWPLRLVPSARQKLDHEQVEGPRWRVVISPGTVAVRRTDPVRADRTRERLESRRWLGHLEVCEDQGCPGCKIAPDQPANGSAGVTTWSRKSRANMVEAIQSLDWSTFLDADRVPAMVTLTYPGDWVAVAPDAATSRGHVLALRKRFERAWGVPLVCVWKREFQERGAPHYHWLMVPPAGRVSGQEFPEWLSSTWAAVVGAEACGSALPLLDERNRIICCERHRHLSAGTGIDYDKGARSTDPRKIGVYFAKHGSFAAKEYQNSAPVEWVEQGTVGRFWGVWGLAKAVAAVEVDANEARAAVRTLRRHSRANSYVVRIPVWRYRTRVDPEGQTVAVWRHATKKQRVWRMKNEAGFVATSNGPALASALARHLDGLYRPGSVVSRSGAGPVGFLP